MMSDSKKFTDMVSRFDTDDEFNKIPSVTLVIGVKTVYYAIKPFTVQ